MLQGYLVYGMCLFSLMFSSLTESSMSVATIPIYFPLSLSLFSLSLSLSLTHTHTHARPSSRPDHISWILSLKEKAFPPIIDCKKGENVFRGRGRSSVVFLASGHDSEPYLRPTFQGGPDASYFMPCAGIQIECIHILLHFVLILDYSAVKKANAACR